MSRSMRLWQMANSAIGGADAALTVPAGEEQRNAERAETDRAREGRRAPAAGFLGFVLVYRPVPLSPRKC